MPYLTPDEPGGPVFVTMSVPDTLLPHVVGAIARLWCMDEWEQFGELTVGETYDYAAEIVSSIQVGAPAGSSMEYIDFSDDTYITGFSSLSSHMVRVIKNDLLVTVIFSIQGQSTTNEISFSIPPYPPLTPFLSAANFYENVTSFDNSGARGLPGAAYFLNSSTVGFDMQKDANWYFPDSGAKGVCGQFSYLTNE